MGFFVESDKIKIPKTLLVLLFLFSLALVPRVNSYTNFINNKAYSLFDPRTELQYNEIKSNEGWVKPDNGDRCWINLKCTMEDLNILIDEGSFFKTAYKEI